MNARCIGCSFAPPIPSTVVMRPAGDGLCRHQAAHDRHAVEQHRAGAADTRAADELGSGQIHLVANDIDQERIRIVGQGFNATIDRHCAHRDLLLVRDWEAAGAMAPATRRRTIRSSSCRRPASRRMIVEAADRNLNTPGKIARCHAVLQGKTLPGTNSIDGFGPQIGVMLDEALIEIAGLKLMLRQQLLGLRRFLDAFEQVAKARSDLRGQNIRQAPAGLLAARGRPRPRPRRRIHAIARRPPGITLPCSGNDDRAPAASARLRRRSGSSTRADSRTWRRRFPQPTRCDPMSPSDNFDKYCQFVKCGLSARLPPVT